VFAEEDEPNGLYVVAAAAYCGGGGQEAGMLPA